MDVYLKFENGIKKGNIELSVEISPEEFLARLRTSIEVIVTPDGIDIDQLLKYNIPTVVTPQFHIGHYEFWFAFQLMVTNSRSIPLMLLYHLERWHNKIRFLNIIEFNTIKIFEKNKPINSDKNADSLFKWMYETRKEYGYATKQEQAKKKHVIDIAYEEINYKTHEDQLKKTIHFDESIIQPLAKILLQYLKNPKDQFELIKALNGEIIKKPIKIKCPMGEFGFLIGLLKNPPYFYLLNTLDNIRDWINLNFLFFDRRTNEFKKASDSYMRLALAGSKPPVRKRAKELRDLLLPLLMR